MKVKIRALTHRQSQQPLGPLLIRLNQIMRGWANYFKHAVAKDRFAALHNFVRWLLIRMLQARHHWSWKDVRRHFTTWNGRSLPITAPDGTELFNMAKVTVTRYRWRGNTIPNRWTPAPA